MSATTACQRQSSLQVFATRQSTRGTQSGVVLIIGLIVLTLMTMIGLAVMRDTSLQERMAGNLRDRDLAFQAAEAALRAGEQWLRANAASQTLNTRIADPTSWDGSTAPAPTASLTLSSTSLAADPVFHVGKARHIEPLGAPCDGTNPNCGFCIFPVTAYAVGGTAGAVVVLQSQYAMQGVTCGD